MKAFKDAVPVGSGFVGLIDRADWVGLDTKKIFRKGAPVAVVSSVVAVFPVSPGPDDAAELVFDLMAGLRWDHPAQVSSSDAAVWVLGFRKSRDYFELRRWNSPVSSSSADRLRLQLVGGEKPFGGLVP